MPCEIALRVVSLPATDSSRKNRLKSMSDSESPSTSALSSVVMMSSRGSSRRFSASAWAYMNISTWAWKTSSSADHVLGVLRADHPVAPLEDLVAVLRAARR